jgi:hypothetical protein
VINNINYSAIINQAKVNSTGRISAERTNELSAIRAEQDTVTLSKAALAQMSGQKVEEIAPTYTRPQTTASLLAENKQATQTEPDAGDKKKESGLRFSEIMQAILDQRLGIDRDKLDEIDATIEDVANNKNLSPEEKGKMLEQLHEMREQVIAESLETKEVAKQMDDESENDDI